MKFIEIIHLNFNLSVLTLQMVLFIIPKKFRFLKNLLVDMR